MSCVDQVKILFGFLHHVSTLSAVDSSTNEDGFATEFYDLKSMSSQLKTDVKYNATIGSLPINKKKNRYKDILPYEQRRVELYPTEGEEGSEYINASYIADPLNKLSYIAAQGPNSYTVNDFWRMLWYHAIEVVVMACREIELGKSKCKQYWVSPGEVRQFGAITVTHVSDDNISEDFIQRKMHVKCGDEDQMLTQLHYTGWPDHGVPGNVKPILNIIKKFRAIVPYGNDVPIVIHCSAGCGRTGTLIGIDYAWSILESKKFKTGTQVYEIVENMRKQRPAMVQTKDQYVLVYKAVFHLVRQYLDEYQHDPSALHLFDKSITEKLNQISLPEPQNPSGIDEVATSTELGGEIEEDLSLSTPASPMHPSVVKENSRQLIKPQMPPQKPFISLKPDITKKPSFPAKSPEPSISVRSLDAIRDNSLPITPELKTAISEQAIRPVIPSQKPLKPSIPQKRVSLSENGWANKFSAVEAKRPSLPVNILPVPSGENPALGISKLVDRPLTNSLPITNKNSLPISRQKSPEPMFNAELTAKLSKSLKAPMPIPPPKMASNSKQASPTETDSPKAINSLSELLHQASIDKTKYSDDDDDDDEADYWEPRNNQPVPKIHFQQKKLDSSGEHILLSPKNINDSPPPLIPPRKSNSNTNLSTSSGSLDAPPLPLKTMEDKDLFGSMENLLIPPPNSTSLIPIAKSQASIEDVYDEIGTVTTEIAPLKPGEIYKAPRSDPVPVAAYLGNNSEKPPSKPNPMPPYQSKSKGVSNILSSLRKPDIFKPNKFVSPNLSHAPNIPVKDTMVTTDDQFRPNKRGNIEYGPVGFGIRLTKPKGPRNMPKHFGNFAKESL